MNIFHQIMTVNSKSYQAMNMWMSFLSACNADVWLMVTRIWIGCRKCNCAKILQEMTFRGQRVTGTCVIKVHCNLYCCLTSPKSRNLACWSMGPLPPCFGRGRRRRRRKRSVFNVIARQGFNFRGRLVLVCRALLFQRQSNAFGTRKVHSAEVE